MADVPKRAGWYPDPDGGIGGAERWWNGVSWSDSRRQNAGAGNPVTVVSSGATVAPPPAVAQYPTPPVVYSASNPAPQAPGAYGAATSVGQVRSAVSINAKLNPMAMNGFIAGLVSVFFNVLLVPGILAIVFSIRGIVRANQLQAAGEQSTLKVFAIAGLLMGIFGTVTGLITAFGIIAGIIASITVSYTP